MHSLPAAHGGSCNFFLTQGGFAVNLPGCQDCLPNLSSLAFTITLWGRVGQDYDPAVAQRGQVGYPRLPREPGQGRARVQVLLCSNRIMITALSLTWTEDLKPLTL